MAIGAVRPFFQFKGERNMADTIQFKRGAAANIPKLADGEPGWCRDTKELFIGTPTGNEKIADASLIATVEQHGQAIAELNEDKLSASAAPAQEELEAEAELTAVVESFNALLSALKLSGIMES